MILRVRMPSIAARATVALALAGTLAGCGAGARSSLSALASPDHDVSAACGPTVLGVLGDIAERIYHEGVFSSRTASAVYDIERSIPLREAVERDDPGAALAAARALIATGHVTSLTVLRGANAAGTPPAGAKRLAEVGADQALAPLRGVIAGVRGTPIATFIASVWADNGFLAEVDGLAEGLTALRENGRSIAGSFALPPGRLPAQGTLTEDGVGYRYTSFPAEADPSGSLRVYLLRTTASTAKLCGASQEDTVANVVSRVARLIYAGEVGPHALAQAHRVQHDQALLGAVARRDRQATHVAIDKLLNEHIVRLRVSAGGQLLSDVGGPYVLAPVGATLRLDGRPIGSFVLSIQDDLGYLRLAQRLVGVDVVIYRGSQLVMSSFRRNPTQVPAGGQFRFDGHTYRAFTFNAQAFPSGPLRITVLIPIPYS
jgi:hypothetical protein